MRKPLAWSWRTLLRVAAASALSAAMTTTMVAQAPTSSASTLRYKCSFEQGRVQNFEAGAFKGGDAAALSFDVAAIDLRRQTAELVTGSGRGQLRIVRAINANHYLEVITEGFLNITTIYEPAESGAPAPAVHSRHVGLLGQPMTAQYTGFCTPVQK
ncbi:MAG: hypothetical protein AAFZ05_02115 [Pseudomonadota bacterium]